jgi:hypothetical protein
LSHATSFRSTASAMRVPMAPQPIMPTVFIF